MNWSTFGHSFSVQFREKREIFFPENSIFMDFGLIEKIFAFLHFPFLTCRYPTPEDPRFLVISLNHNLK